MKRIAIQPRENWQAKVEALDFQIHKDYWNEEAYYEFTEAEIENLYAVANDLHAKCIEVLNKHYYDIIDFYDLPLAWKDYIEHSFHRTFSLYGRFDFAIDRYGIPKLLEYNADTPTSLYEASVVQWFWLKERFWNEDQFNSLHEALIDHWKNFIVDGGTGDRIYFTCMEQHEEDFITTRYIMDCAAQAGYDTRFIDIEKIGYKDPFFVDEEDNPIDQMFKLYPYEWLMKEDFGRHVTKDFCNLVEPVWKYLLSNKLILPLLYKYYPDHPNLLPAYYESMFTGFDAFVCKPRIGREGSNISINLPFQQSVKTDGPYADEKKIYQKLVDRDAIDGYYPTIGIWMVGNEARGMGIREDRSLITGNTSKFVPHLFKKES